MGRLSLLPAILRSLAFLSFSLANSLRTTLTGGSFREKVVLNTSRQDSGSTLDDGISEASFSPTIEKCRFSSSAISDDSVIICSLTLISAICNLIRERFFTNSVREGDAILHDLIYATRHSVVVLLRRPPCWTRQFTSRHSEQL